MPDTVNTTTIYSGAVRHAIQITNISDGTGESEVIKVNKSDLTINGAEPSLLSIQEAEWSISGFTSVQLFWDHDTDDEALVLAGGGYKDFRPHGGLRDPESTGGTGDLILTTVGAAAACTYDIVLNLRKHV